MLFFYFLAYQSRLIDVVPVEAKQGHSTIPRYEPVLDCFTVAFMLNGTVCPNGGWGGGYIPLQSHNIFLT